LTLLDSETACRRSRSSLDTFPGPHDDVAQPKFKARRYYE
jgi:hypothetical protein